MNVTSMKMHSNNNYKSNSNVRFTGTTEQIIKTLETHGVSHDKGFCNDKANFVIEIMDLFIELQKQGISCIYKLGEKNVIPTNAKEIKVNGKNLEIWDNDLNDPKQRFQCSGGCPCGEGSTKGEFLIDLFNLLKIPEPKEIKTVINN